MNINFSNTIIDQSQSYPNKIAYRDGTEDLSYGDLCIRIKQFANGLKNSNITTGDRVIVVMEDCVDWPPIFLACVYLGIIPVPISVNIPQELFSNIVKFVDAKLIIAGNSIAKSLDTKSTTVITRETLNQFKLLSADIAPVFVHPDSIGYLGLSSGTTGTPKIAAQRHQAFFEVAKIMAISYDMTADTIFLSIPKMSWGYGLHNSITTTLSKGATAILIPDLPAPSIVFEYLHKYQPTVVATSPTIIKKLLKYTRKKYTMPPSVVRFMTGGEDLPGSVYDEFLKRFGIKLDIVIGMLEVTNVNYASTTSCHGKGILGIPHPGVTVEIRTSNGSKCDVNQVGEIYIKSKCNSFYYYNNYQKTQETFFGEWVKSGDYAYWNNNQQLVFVGRANDVFKINELLVSPIEIEAELSDCSLIEQIAIVGVDNIKGNKEVHAFVIPSAKFNLDEFKKLLELKLFPHQVPKHIHTISQMPETVTNKKDRKELVKYVTKLY